ncbi:MAG: S8 family serine peptidase [candidate division Zixibacteria bacterium]|nr:S8 family serine peptidase [candidate division Zixibacteria bacterium]
MANLLRINRAVIWVILPVLLLFFAGQVFATDLVSQQAIAKIGAGKSAQQAAQAVNGTISDSIPGKMTYLISFPDSLTVSQALSTLNGNSNVDTAEANHIMEFTEIDQVDMVIPDQNDPPLLKGSSPPNFYGHPGYDAIKADSAHKISEGENVVVAIIDNGIDFDHPLFDSVFKDNGYDFVDDDTSAAEDSGSYYGHGTFVAGIIMRIAPKCKLIPYRAFDEDGSGNVFDIASAIYRAVSDTAHVLNLSFSMTTNNAILKNAISAAFDADISMAAAPGNDSSDVTVYPADYKGVVGVSAIDTLDVISDFSNYGDLIDICAPGEDVYSSLAGDYEWGTWSGTSFSAPMATGVMALMLSLEPNLDPVRVEEVLQGAAETDLQWGTVVPDDSLYGYGRVDALAAVSELNKGDVDYSGEINDTDMSYMEQHLYDDGPAPVPLPNVGDLDCSGDVDLADYQILINYLNYGGPKPTPCE